MGRFHQPRQPHAERLRELSLTPGALTWISTWLDRLVALGAPRPFVYGLRDDTGDGCLTDAVHLEWDVKRPEGGPVFGWAASLECGPGPGRCLWAGDTGQPIGCAYSSHEATVTLDDATTERIAAVLRGMGDLP